LESDQLFLQRVLLFFGIFLQLKSWPLSRKVEAVTGSFPGSRWIPPVGPITEAN
jgi:hypothetical protein